MEQLAALTSRLAQGRPPTILSVVLLARSSKSLYTKDYSPIDLSTWETAIESSTDTPLAIPALLKFLTNAPGRVVCVDNTSSQEIANSYPQLLEHGISVVTPNKKAFSGSYELWESIQHAAASASAGLCFHESSVGAGLPVISTLMELIMTGDEIRRIEGVFSGTMSFLFNSFAPLGGGGGKFSDEVRKARELGYTEPDPRDDLNGLDVARKLTILGRLSGLRIESPTSFPVQSLIPAPLESAASADDFMAKLSDYDAVMDKVKSDAEAQGKVVRYVGSIDVASKTVKVGLESFDPSHPIAALKGSDNIISFYTKRYGASPLVIQGAGAGGEVTAMGVTGDLLRVLQAVH